MDAIFPPGQCKQDQFVIKSQLLNLSGLSIYFTASYGFKSPVYLQVHAGGGQLLYPRLSVSGNVSIHRWLNAPLTLLE